MAKKVKKSKKKKTENLMESARLKVLRLLDEVLSKPSNQKKIKQGFQGAIDEDPVLFYRQVVKPTAEKELFLAPAGDGKVHGVKFIFGDDDGDLDSDKET